jgi:plastocyanin
MTTRRAATLIIALALVSCLAACSNRKASPNREPHTGSGTASVVNGVQQVTLVVNRGFRFSPSTITVHQGQVKITLVHQATGAPHDFSVPDFPADNVPLTQAGQTRSTTFTTPSPGTYKFVCTIHVAQGMTGTLVVLPS